MESSKQKEYLSISYLRAVAANADVLFNNEIEDSDSIDVRLKKQIFIKEKPFWADIGIQLKATNSISQYTETNDMIKYKLKVKNYNDLRLQASTKKYLALLILPENPNEWVEQDVEKLIIKRAMYWVSLEGEPETINKDTIRINIPKKNVLDKDALNNLIERFYKEMV